MSYIEVLITPTGKSFHPSAEWHHLASRPERVTFANLDEAKVYLGGRYGSCKRQPMYIDTGAGAKQVGYIYGFRNADWSHAPVEHWLQQDWVTINTVEPADLGE